jgi:glutaredoxin
MKITLYRSAICPRCLMAARELKRLKKKYKNLVVTEIDIATSPRQTWQAGIRMIPALECRGKILSGFILTSEKIQKFITTEQQKKNHE